MKHALHTFFISIIAITLFSQFFMSEAQAKRFGGGASFGSRPSFNKSFKRAPVKRSLSPSQKQAATKNQAIRNNMSRRGGMMGMLGALAMGGLLGSLLFGGAFENFNLFDIVIIGGILFLAFKLMTRTQRPATAHPYTRSSYTGNDEDFDSSVTTQNQARAFDTDLMFKKGQSADQQPIPMTENDFSAIAIEDFDQTAFLEGAKGAFTMLQQAWDTGDQSEIRRMTTDKVFAEIKQQLQNNSTTNQTEIMSLSAEILTAGQSGNQLEVDVLFDANIHELPESITSNIQEVWHFIRPANSRDSMWFVDGIQQVD